MARNILAVLGCVVLSAVLFVASVLIFSRLSVAGKFMLDPSVYTQDPHKYGDPFVNMKVVKETFQFIIAPLVALGVGLFAAFSAKSRVSLVALAGVLPMDLLIVANGHFQMKWFFSALLYAALSSTTAVLVARARHRREPPQAI